MENNILTPTNDNVIKSISYDQAEIIKNILKLHVPNNRIECDITYSKGNFYKKTGIEKPSYIFDKFPQTEDTVQLGDVIPLEDNSVNSIMVDLPFIVGGMKNVHRYDNGSCIIGKRFEQFRNISDLFETYNHWIDESYRVLNENGVLIFKCQDTVSSKKQYLTHVNSIIFMSKIGFYVKDLFSLIAKSRIISPKHINQQHARKYNSYFIVAEKKNTKIKYY